MITKDFKPITIAALLVKNYISHASKTNANMLQEKCLNQYNIDVQKEISAFISKTASGAKIVSNQFEDIH